MTGTDLYRDMAIHHEVIQSMQMADVIVLLQSAAMSLIPEDLRSKVHIIYQSTKSVKRKPLLKKQFLVSVIGHLRPEKDPFCTAQSLEYLPSESKIRVLHLGEAMSSEMRQLAKSYSAKLERYQWLDKLSHADTVPSFYKSLEQHLKKRNKYVQPQFEMKSIKNVIEGLV